MALVYLAEREDLGSKVAIKVLRDDQAQLAEAEHLAREGRAMTKRHLPPNHPAVAKATTALGRVLAHHGAYGAAIQTLDEAVRLQSTKGAPTPELMASLYQLASAHFSADHYEISESLSERLLPVVFRNQRRTGRLDLEAVVQQGKIEGQPAHTREVKIVDLSHARQHRWELARRLYPNHAGKQRAWMKVHQQRLLDKVKIEKLVGVLRALRCSLLNGRFEDYREDRRAAIAA